MSGYPFTGVVGQDTAKQALLLSLVCPDICGVLLTGEKGTAKSTIVRSLAELCSERQVINLPLNATEDRVLGTLNLEKAIRYGECSFEPGLLLAADQGILYIDEVNLLSETLVNAILDAAASGVNRVEREGISHSHAARFVLIGSMNPEEGSLTPQLLDRFGLVVPVTGVKEPVLRKQIINRRLEYESDPIHFRESFREEQEQLAKRIRRAQSELSKVMLPDEMENLILVLNRQANIVGHRADIVLSKAARAAAALAGRLEVIREDVETTAPLVLCHRARVAGIEADGDITSTSESIHPGKSNTSPGLSEHGWERETLEGIDNRQLLDDLLGEITQEEIFEIGETYPVRDLFWMGPDRRERRMGSGRRSKSRTMTQRGRYIKYRIPKDGEQDIAIDATLRAAAPHQRNREPRDTAVVIHSSDFRRKVREKRIGNTILFLVDASGSMRAQRRMAAAKGAVLSLLKDAYQKRDEVGMLAFRGQKVDVLLHPTRSIDLAQKRLERLPTGGRTPLTLGLSRTMELIRSLRLKDPDILPVVVLVTDGRANVALSSGDPFQEACQVAARSAERPVRFLVVDTEAGPVRFGRAKTLSTALKAEYYPLEELCTEMLVDAMRELI
jgi:magnesium chelatase subunit D